MALAAGRALRRARRARRRSATVARGRREHRRRARKQIQRRVLRDSRGGRLLLTPERGVLRSRWFFAGAALAFAIALPNLLWQALHGFPMWELLQNGAHGKNVAASPSLFILQQLILTNLFVAPVWIGGLIWAFATKPARFIAWSYVLLIATMIALHAKHYYPADTYPVLIAAGGVAWESWTRRATVARPFIAAAALAAAIFFAPLTLPVLAESQTVRYTAFVTHVLHVQRSALKTERMRTSVLPEDFADMHGWPQLVATVARVYDALPPTQRAQTAIVASNYGEAAAIDFFGAAYGLPPAISGHNNYWLWGTHGYSGNVVVDVNGDCGADSDPTLFRVKRVATHFDAPWVISYERDIPIGVYPALRGRCRRCGRSYGSIFNAASVRGKPIADRYEKLRVEIGRNEVFAAAGTLARIKPDKEMIIAIEHDDGNVAMRRTRGGD